MCVERIYPSASAEQVERIVAFLAGNQARTTSAFYDLLVESNRAEVLGWMAAQRDFASPCDADASAYPKPPDPVAPVIHDEPPLPKPVRSYSTYAVGWLSHRSRPRKGDVLIAVREPENSYDPNAIALWLGTTEAGHVPRREAAQIAPLMDEGYRIEVVCTRARGNSKKGAKIDVRLFGPDSEVSGEA